MLAGALGVALAFGWATQRLGLSTLVGYLLAGVVVGPQTPGFVADAQLASQMAEIGVILLMFGVGMHFHPEQLLRVWRIAVPGAIAQSATAGVFGWAAARAFGWSHVAGIVFGMALAVASTVVLMRMLVEQDRLSTRDGHVAVGWLIVEDLLCVVGVVLLPAVAAEETCVPAGEVTLGVAIGKVAVFAAIVWALGTRLVAPIMERIARTRSAELFTLMVFVIALGIAILASEVFNISVALGAFFAGLVVGQSRFGTQAAADMTPFRDVFSALFFVSVGMLFNPGFVLSQPLIVLAALAVVLLVKPLVALAIVMILRDTTRTALTVSVGLAQIGEFSFILAALGSSLKILPAEGMDALVTVALVSIGLNPVLFRAARVLERRLAPNVADEAQTAAASAQASDGSPRAIPVIITGLGELGRRLARRCAASGVQVCVIDDRNEALDEFRRHGVATVSGDPGDEKILREGGVADARMLVVTSASLAAKMRVCIAARAINPRIAIVATSESAAERAWLEELEQPMFAMRWMK